MTSTINLTVTIILFKNFWQEKVKSDACFNARNDLMCKKKRNQQVVLCYCSFKLLQADGKMNLYSLRCQTSTAGCNTLMCHQRSLWDWSLHGARRLLQTHPDTDYPLSVKCFAVSATFGMNTVNLYCP